MTQLDHQRRFGGVQRLYGSFVANKIFGAHVVVVGIGGVGSWSAEALARSGVGRITLIDMDHVTESNINRQIHALDATLGQAKVMAMRQRIHDIHPECKVHTIDDFVIPDNWLSIVHQANSFAPITAVIDACDHVLAKTTMAAWALKNKKIPFIAVGAAGGKQQAERVQIADLSEVTHDPLLAKLRYNLRRHHQAARQNSIGIACVCSPESTLPPQINLDNSEPTCAISHAPARNENTHQNAKPASDGTLNCRGFGSSVAVTATFGLCAAGWVLRHLK